MTERGKSNAAWNECIGQLKGTLIKRQDAQIVSLTLNEYLEAKFQGTGRKVPLSAANQVGIKYGIDPALLTSVKKSAEQFIIARSGQIIYGENAFDLSGWSTDISEDGLTLAVGSILNDGVNGQNTGSVRVYARSNADEAWVQKGVDIDGEAAQDYSGWSVSLSADGDRIVIGAVFNDSGVNENAGHVRVYDWNSSTSQWDKVGDDIEGEDAGDFFGYSVSLSKNKNFIAVGAPYGSGTRGYVRVYQENNGSWDQIHLDQIGSEEGDLFGKHVALSEDGSRLVVASPNALQSRGVVYLYRVDSTITLLMSKNGRDSGVRFGNSFDFKSNILAISETGTNQPNITTYDISSDTFEELQNGRITLTGAIDVHLKLSYDGSNLVFGMPAFNSEDRVLNSRPIPFGVKQTGHAEIYKREGDQWKIRGWRLKGVSGRDEFAKSVAISGDGETVCISIPRNDDGGRDRGSVTAYTVKPISHYVTPTITLTGLNPFPLEANTSYVEPGATTDTGASVTISGDIEDNTTEGNEYEIEYRSQNGFGSVVTKTRKVVITKDPTIPTMTLNGDALVTIPVNGVFNDPGVTTSILSTVNIDDSGVDTSKVGVYEIKYTAVSSYGVPSLQDMRRTLVVVYETDFYGTPQVGKISCMSRDGFILAIGDFVENTVRLYEWDLIGKDWKRIGQVIEGPYNSSFGAAIDLSSDGLTVVIGAPTYSGTIERSGLIRVYKYDFIVDQWEQVDGDILDEQIGDNLGEFVAISGDGSVISCGTARPTGSKNPYVFTYKRGTSWTKIHTYTEPVKLASGVTKKKFSGSLNFNGSRLLLGVPVNNYTTGAVFLFDVENDVKLASVFGKQIGDNLGQSVRFSGDGSRFVLNDVTNGRVKIYNENKLTRVWNKLGGDILEGYGGTAVDLSHDGNIVTFSTISNTNRGTVHQYKWDGAFWMPYLSELTDLLDGNSFGRKVFATGDGSKIFVESNSSFQLYRWILPRASLSFNGARIIRRQVDEPYNYDYVVSSANVTTVGVVNEAVTNDYLIKYIITKNGQSDVAYQLVSVSGELLQLGLGIQNIDESSTPNNHGWSSSMSGDGEYIILGSPGYDNNRGMVKIYRFNPVTIHWDVMISINGPNTNGRFGHSVSFSKNGSRVAVGAPDYGDGLVRVYEYDEFTWNQIGTDLTGSTEGKFGWSVSLNNSGSHVTVGEPRKTFGPNTGAGEVHTYEYVGSWTPVNSLSFINNQIEHQLGYAVVISSSTDVVMCSAPTAGPGYVKISSFVGGNVPIFAQPISFGERFGWSISISDDGNTFAAGAPFYSNKRGRVIVYDATTTPPSVKGSPIVGADVNDELGSSIHLVGNGTKIMIYTKKGRVTNYTYENSEWVILNSEVITSEDLNGSFGYSLSSSTDGSRMILTSPLSDDGYGLVQIYSDETSQIQNSDFVAPVLSLNGPAIYRTLLDTAYVDPGVRRDDALPGFTTQGTVNTNVAGSYTLTYIAEDISGNISDPVSRIVDVIDPTTTNNKISSFDGPNSGQNNSTIQMAASGKRVAVATGVLPENYISWTRLTDKSIGLQGTVKVFEMGDNRSVVQYGQTLTSNEIYFGTSVLLSQDGTKLCVMSTPDPDSVRLSVYGINNDLYKALEAPFSRTEESSVLNNTFNLPDRYYGFHDYADVHVFGEPDVDNGRIGNFMRYRNNSLASSSDGRVVAIGIPSSPDGTGGGVSVYRQSSTVTTSDVFTTYGGQLSETFDTGCDLSEDGRKFIVSSGTETYIYSVDDTGYSKEAEFEETESGVNAISRDGNVAAFSSTFDVEPPLTLNGDDRITIIYGSSWSDPGFSYDGSDNVTISGSVDSNVIGDHYIKYETPTQTRVRIVTVTPEITFDGSVVESNVPYGPGFAGWTGTWRNQSFPLFTSGVTYDGLADVSIKLNGRIPVAGNWQYMGMSIYTDSFNSGGFSFTSNGSGQGESYSSSLGSVYTDKTVTRSDVSVNINSGEIVYLRLDLYNTYFSTFDVEVNITLKGAVTTISRIPILSLVGFTENDISVGENFTDPGFTSDNSSDILTKVLDPVFPQSDPCSKAILYQALSPEGINGYAVRYVNVRTEQTIKVVNYQGNSWNSMGNSITIPANIRAYTPGDVVLSTDGNRVAFSRYIMGRGYVFTYESNPNVYPPTWDQYGSTIELDARSFDSPGFSLAVSGNGERIVIGSPSAVPEDGKVYVFDYVDGDWQEHSSMTSAGLTLYGYSVDITKDGTHIVIGSREDVSVFELSENTYTLKGGTLSRTGNDSDFGRIVSISDDGNSILTNVITSFGLNKVVYYNYINNTWEEYGTYIDTGSVNPGLQLSGDGTKVLTIGAFLKTTIPQTLELEAGWSQMGVTITPNDLIPVQPLTESPPANPGERTSPGEYTNSSPNLAAFMGLVVDLSHDGLTLAIGLPFLEMGTPVNTRGAAVVFQWDGLSWQSQGDLIVPYYEYNQNLHELYNGTPPIGNDDTFNLNLEAEKSMFSGASLSLSGNGQYLCVGSPGYLSNPIDEDRSGGVGFMHALPNAAGLTSWTLFKRNPSWNATQYSTGWEPVVTKYSDISESLSHIGGSSNYNEEKRELLGLGVKVSYDGSFVVYDTRTDGIKVLAKDSNNNWTVQRHIRGDTTRFLTKRDIFTRSNEMADSTSYNSSYMKVPSATNGRGAYPSKFWPISYISLSAGDEYLTISEPVFDPLGLRLSNWNGSTVIEQNEDIRMGRVTSYRLTDDTIRHESNISIEEEVKDIIEENSPITLQTSMNLYEPLNIAVSKDGLTIAVASVIGKNQAVHDVFQSDKKFVDPTEEPSQIDRNYRSWIQVYTYVNGQWTRKGSHISPGAPTISYEGDNDELFLGQFMDLSGDGSRLVTTGTSFHLRESTDSGYANSHEVYVYEFNGSGEWVTTSGSAEYPERIFIRSKRQYRKLNPSDPSQWLRYSDLTLTDYEYNQGSFEDNYALGSIGGVSISEDGSRIAISTSNYSGNDFSGQAGQNKTSRCIEMVLIFEYHQGFHTYEDYTESSDEPKGLNVFPYEINHQDFTNRWGANLFTPSFVTSPTGYTQHSVDARDFENVYIHTVPDGTGNPRQANWKLLHWEVFKAELDMSGSSLTRTTYPANDGGTPTARIPHSIVSGVKFSGNDVLVIERYDNAAGVLQNVQEYDKDMYIINWTSSNIGSSSWQSVTWSPELGIFAAVASYGGTNRVMTSSNGIDWTSHSVESSDWRDVTWSPELGIFVAVASYGGNRVMTSSNGIDWTSHSVESSTWISVTWSPELGIFVAVAAYGTYRVMTSSNGIDWTSSNTLSGSYPWRGVTWSPELGIFAAVAGGGGTSRVETSTNGIDWMSHNTVLSNWADVTWSPELGIFVAVADNGTKRVMTSSNGIDWTSHSVESSKWRSVTWSPELGIFLAVADNGTNRVMTSSNGIDWTSRNTGLSDWISVTWSPELGIFVAVADNGTNRVMTSSIELEAGNYNPNRYPQLLVFDQGKNQVTSRTTQLKGVQDSRDVGIGVRWGGTWTVPDTSLKSINGDSDTRDDGWWINPITGWMLLDFERSSDLRPSGYEDVPYSVDVSDIINVSDRRIVFGVPHANNHRGKIQVFDVSTHNHTQTINGVDYNTYRYVLTQVGGDIFGDQVKGRFGENVSISGDGSRIAIGNRPFYLDDGRGSGIYEAVDTKFYLYEYNSTNGTFTKGVSKSLSISKSLENQQTRTLQEFQNYFYDRVEHNVFTQWGRPPCFLEQEDVDVGINASMLIFDKPSKIWVDSRFRESKVKLTSNGAFVFVSVFNDFIVYDIGAETTVPFQRFGQIITQTPQTSITTNIDEFPYSGSTISNDGKVMVVPVSVIPNKFGTGTVGHWKKQITIYEYDDDTLSWEEGTTNTIEDTTITFDGSDNFPRERTFLSFVSSDKLRVSSLYAGGHILSDANVDYTFAPTFRQHIPSGEQESVVWTKVRPDIYITSTDINKQQWIAERTSSDPPSDRLPAFVMSNDGNKIAIGNTNDTLHFSSVNGTRKSGSVSIYTYNISNLNWNIQKITVDDNSSELSINPYIPARFGHSLALTSDGTRLVVSAPGNRDGAGDIFIFDTSTATAAKESVLQNPGDTTEFGYSLALNDDGSRLLVGDPFYNSETGRVIIQEYDNITFTQQTYITPGKSIETFNGESFSEKIRFGESIDVSGDGTHLIASRFGKLASSHGYSDRGDVVRDYYIASGGIEIAEKWNLNTETDVWELEEIGRIKTGTDIGTDPYTPSWDASLSDSEYSRFHFFSDDAPKKPNVKISDSGEFYMVGMASLKEPGKLLTENPRTGETSTFRHPSNVSIYRTIWAFTPIITLNGDAIMEIVEGGTYVEPGATSDDPADVIIITGTVNTNVIGNYVVRYEVVRDGQSNFAERTVKVVVVSDPPTLTLIGPETVELQLPTSYTEPDPPATYSGGTLEIYGEPPDGSVPGVFKIRYQVRNSLGIATAERTVTILQDITPPIVTIVGGDVTHKYNTTYKDASYIGSDGNEDVITTTPSYVQTITDVGKYRGLVQVTYSAVDVVGNVGTATRDVDVRDIMEATALQQQLDDSYYSTISGDGSRIAVIRKTTNDVVLYGLPATISTFVDGWSGFGSMEGQMVKLSSDGQIIAFTTPDGVHVYENVSGSWNERLAVPSRFVEPGSTAYRIEMSGDGSTIAVSYPGGNAQYLEEVLVFRWDSMNYVEDHSVANGTSEVTGLGTAMSLSSDGNRLALGFPSVTPDGGISITSPGYGYYTTPSPTLVGVYQQYGYRLTTNGIYGANNTMYWQVNLGPKWTATWQWYIYGPRWGGADDMRMIYYATNPITAYQASVHNGYNNFYEFWLGDTHQIRDNKDIYKKTQNVYYGTSRWLDVEVSYDNGIMKSTIWELYRYRYSSQYYRRRLVSTLTHDFGTEHQHLYGQPTYFGFSGRTGGVTSTQTIRRINLNQDIQNSGEIDVYERSGPNSWTQVDGTIFGGLASQGMGSSVKLSGDGSTLVNVNSGVNGNDQKVSVFSLVNGTWTRNTTLLDNLRTRTLSGNSNDLVDISNDGTLLIYARGGGSETYALHPDGLETKYIDGFRLENGQYTPVLLIPENSTTSSLSTSRVEVSEDGSKVLIQADDKVVVYDVTESVFSPVITLNYRDDLDTITVSGAYTEEGAVSNVTDGSSVVVGGDTVTNTAGTYRVTYSVTDTNTGKSGHRTRTVIIN